MSSSWGAAIAILGRNIIQIELQHDTTDTSPPTSDATTLDLIIEADGDHGLIVDHRMGYQPRQPA
jgi:hypothetical protein